VPVFGVDSSQEKPEDDAQLLLEEPHAEQLESVADLADEVRMQQTRLVDLF